MEFKINQLDRNTDGDIVTTVHWSAIKQDDEFTASSYGAVGVDAGDTVIPFDELTEDTVIEWVEAKLDLVELENNLDAQIQEQKTPKVASGLPW
jgi:hypothetical protein